MWRHIGIDMVDRDSDFIAHAREDIPALLEDRAALQAENAELRAKLAELKIENKIVYCRNCKYHENYMCLHEQWDTKKCSHYTFDDDYCSYGEAAESALAGGERGEMKK